MTKCYFLTYSIRDCITATLGLVNTMLELCLYSIMFSTYVRMSSRQKIRIVERANQVKLEQSEGLLRDGPKTMRWEEDVRKKEQ